MFRRRIEELKSANLYRTIKDRSSPQSSRIGLDGKELINFSSNDYLGLANHPEVIKAACSAMKEFGFGGGASRLLGGGSVLHGELEDKVAGFKGTEAALVFNSGYAANTGIIPSIAGEEDIILSDEMNHASIIDGCRLSRAKTLVYRHKDIAHLEELIGSSSVPGRGNYIIVTDGVFSMDGDIAPLKDIYALCLAVNSESRAKNTALLYIDDAHGTGVLGRGKGALAHYGIGDEPWIIQMGTFSKALGSFGAFVAGNREMVEWIINTARSFIFSTAIPACAVAASIKALDIIEGEPALLDKLWSNYSMLVSELRETGYDPGGTETPIIPLKTKSVDEALKLSKHLYDKGIYVPAIRPPTVKEPRLRITVTAAHSEEDIRRLINALSEYQSKKV